MRFEDDSASESTSQVSEVESIPFEQALTGNIVSHNALGAQPSQKASEDNTSGDDYDSGHESDSSESGPEGFFGIFSRIKSLCQRPQAISDEDESGYDSDVEQSEEEAGESEHKQQENNAQTPKTRIVYIPKEEAEKIGNAKTAETRNFSREAEVIKQRNRYILLQERKLQKLKQDFIIQQQKRKSYDEQKAKMLQNKQIQIKIHSEKERQRIEEEFEQKRKGLLKMKQSYELNLLKQKKALEASFKKHEIALNKMQQNMKRKSLEQEKEKKALEVEKAKLSEKQNEVEDKIRSLSRAPKFDLKDGNDKDVKKLKKKIKKLKKKQSKEIGRVQQETERELQELKRKKEELSALLSRVQQNEALRQEEIKFLHQDRDELLRLNADKEEQIIELHQSTVSTMRDEFKHTSALNQIKDNEFKSMISSLKEELAGLKLQEQVSPMPTPGSVLSLQGPSPSISTASRRSHSRYRSKQHKMKAELKQVLQDSTTSPSSESDSSYFNDAEKVKLEKIKSKISDVKKRSLSRNTSTPNDSDAQSGMIDLETPDLRVDTQNLAHMHEAVLSSRDSEFEREKTLAQDSITRQKADVERLEVQLNSDSLKERQRLLEKEKEVFELEKKKHRMEEVKQRLEQKAEQKRLIEIHQTKLQKEFEQRLVAQKQEEERFRMQQQDEESTMLRRSLKLLELRQKETELLRKTRERLMSQEMEQIRRKREIEAETNRLGVRNQSMEPRNRDRAGSSFSHHSALPATEQSTGNGAGQQFLSQLERESQKILSQFDAERQLVDQNWQIEQKMLQKDRAELEKLKLERLSRLLVPSTQDLDDDMKTLLQEYNIEKSAKRFIRQGAVTLKQTLNLDDSQFSKIGFRNSDQISSFRKVLTEKINAKESDEVDFSMLSPVKTTKSPAGIDAALLQVLTQYGIAKIAPKFVDNDAKTISQALLLSDQVFKKIGFKTDDQITNFKRILKEELNPTSDKTLEHESIAGSEPKDVAEVSNKADDIIQEPEEVTADEEEVDVTVEEAEPLPDKEAPTENVAEDVTESKCDLELLLEKAGISNLFSHFESEGIIDVTEAKQLSVDDIERLGIKNVNDRRKVVAVLSGSTEVQSPEEQENREISADLMEILEATGMDRVSDKFKEHGAFTIREALNLSTEAYLDIGLKREDQVEKIKTYLRDALEEEGDEDAEDTSEAPDVEQEPEESFNHDVSSDDGADERTLDDSLVAILEATGLDRVSDQFLKHKAYTIEDALALSNDQFFDIGLKREDQIEKIKKYFREALEDTDAGDTSQTDDDPMEEGEPENELHSFLSSNGLETYFDKFEDQGILDMSEVRHMSGDDFERLGIKIVSDRRKLLALLKGEDVPESEEDEGIDDDEYQDTAPAALSDSNDEAETKPEKHKKRHKKKKKRKKKRETTVDDANSEEDPDSDSDSSPLEAPLMAILESYGIENIAPLLVEQQALSVDDAVKLSDDQFRAIGFKNDTQIDGFRNVLKQALGIASENSGSEEAEVKPKKKRRRKKKSKKKSSEATDDNAVTDGQSDDAPENDKAAKKKKKKKKRREKARSTSPASDAAQLPDDEAEKDSGNETDPFPDAASEDSEGTQISNEEETIAQRKARRKLERKARRQKRRALKAPEVPARQDSADEQANDTDQVSDINDNSSTEPRKKKKKKKRKKKKAKEAESENEKSDSNTDSDDGPDPGGSGGDVQPTSDSDDEPRARKRSKKKKKHRKKSKSKSESSAAAAGSDTDASVIFTSNNNTNNAAVENIDPTLEEKTPDIDSDSDIGGSENHIFVYDSNSLSDKSINSIVSLLSGQRPEDIIMPITQVYTMRTTLPSSNSNWEVGSDGVDTLAVDGPIQPPHPAVTSLPIASSSLASGPNSVFEAIKQGKLDEVKRYLKTPGFDINKRDKSGDNQYEDSWIGNLFSTASGLTTNFTPLFVAVSFDNFSIAELLLQNGALDESCECVNVVKNEEMLQLLEKYGFTKYGDINKMSQEDKDKINLIKQKKKELSRTHSIDSSNSSQQSSIPTAAEIKKKGANFFSSVKKMFKGKPVQS